MPSFAIPKFTVLLEPLWVSAEFLLLSTGPILDGTLYRLAMGSDLLFLWKKLKTGNEKSGRTADHGNPPAFVM